MNPLPGNRKALFNQRQHRYQLPTPTRKQIQRDHPLLGPGVEGHVRLQQHPDAGDAEGDEGVAVVGEEGKFGFVHDVYHSTSEAVFRVEEGRVDVFDVDEEVLARGEVDFSFGLGVGVSGGLVADLVAGRQGVDVLLQVDQGGGGAGGRVEMFIGTWTTFFVGDSLLLMLLLLLLVAAAAVRGAESPRNVSAMAVGHEWMNE